MGLCQSQLVDPLIGKNVTIDSEPTKPPPSPLRSPRRKRNSRGHNNNKLSIVVDNNGNGNGPMSPSGDTQPETPMSLLSPGSCGTKSRPGQPKTPRTLVSMIAMSTPDLRSPAATTETSSVDEFDELRQCSLLGLDNIIIPEETDPDAPSDEEESYLRYVEQTHKQNGVSEWEMEPGPIYTKANNTSSRNMSPPRPQSTIKLRNKKITRPGSIQYHHDTTFSSPSPPLVVPPPGAVFFQKPTPQSVDRSHLAVFSKLKVQAKLQQKEASMKRRRGKLEDRYSDVQSYRRLYKEFEDMQSSVHDVLKERPQSTRERSKSIDLNDPESWWYNFHAMADDSDGDDDTSDDESVYSHQTQYSLLSAASMESQRLFFAAKKAQTTSSKLQALEDILNGIKDKKKGGGHTKGGSKPASNDDYGPPSRQNSLRRLSISSGLTCDTASKAPQEYDYGPVSRPASRRNSNTSSIGYNIDVTAATDYGRGGVVGVKQNPEETIELGGQEEVKKVMSSARKSKPDYDGLSEATRFMMQSAAAAQSAATPEKNDNPAEAETPVTKNVGGAIRKRLLLSPPLSQEDEKKDDFDRQPRWRTWDDDDDDAVKEKSVTPGRSTYTPSIATMSTEDFLLLSEEAAVVRIMRMPGDDDDDEDEDGVVQARRLAYDDDDDDDGVQNRSISTIDR